MDPIDGAGPRWRKNEPYVQRPATSPRARKKLLVAIGSNQTSPNTVPHQRSQGVGCGVGDTRSLWIFFVLRYACQFTNISHSNHICYEMFDTNFVRYEHFSLRTLSVTKHTMRTLSHTNIFIRTFTYESFLKQTFLL